MSASSPPPGGSERDDGDIGTGPEGTATAASGATMAGIDVTPDDQRRAGEALRASFARLAPQGSDEWNFMGAFTLLGDRFGPYQPGASELADVLGDGGAAGRVAGRRGAGGRLSRLRGGGGGAASGAGAGAGGGTAGGPGVGGAERSDFDEAMGHIIEAFRFLHARMVTLEARLGAEDVPLEGAAWLAPARALGTWVEPAAAFVRGHSPGGEVVHADCGDGELVVALSELGMPATGVEPRGGVALRALERGCAVTISEASEFLAAREDGSLGGVVLSGVVDRLPLHAVIPLLAHCRRALAPGAPVVVVSEAAAEPAHAGEPTTGDLVDGHSLHSQTWGLLLERIGFSDVAGLAGEPDSTDHRFGVTATTPTT